MGKGRAQPHPSGRGPADGPEPEPDDEAEDERGFEGDQAQPKLGRSEQAFRPVRAVSPKADLLVPEAIHLLFEPIQTAIVGENHVNTPLFLFRGRTLLFPRGKLLFGPASSFHQPGQSLGPGAWTINHEVAGRSPASLNRMAASSTPAFTLPCR